MATIIVKTIKGRQYEYLQHSVREGDKVRTPAVYLGPVGGGVRKKKDKPLTGWRYTLGAMLAPMDDEEKLAAFIAREMEKNAPLEKEREAQRLAEEKERAQKFYDRTGLKLPGTNPTAAAPEVKASAPVDPVPPVAPPPAEPSSNDEPPPS